MLPNHKKRGDEMKKNSKIYIPIIVLFIAMLVYALGFSSNLAYANEDYILYPADYPIAEFNRKIQPFNNVIFYMIIGLFLLLAFVYLTNSHKRTKFLVSNIISVSILAAGMTVFSLVNFIKLPQLIKEYSALLANHPDQFERSNNIYSLIPSNFMYIVGLVLASISLLYAIFMIINLVFRMKHQKAYIAERDEVLASAKWKVTLPTK